MAVLDSRPFVTDGKRQTPYNREASMLTVERDHYHKGIRGFDANGDPVRVTWVQSTFVTQRSHTDPSRDSPTAFSSPNLLLDFLFDLSN